MTRSYVNKVINNLVSNINLNTSKPCKIAVKHGNRIHRIMFKIDGNSQTIYKSKDVKDVIGQLKNMLEVCL